VCAECHVAEIGDALNAFEQQRQQNSTLLGQLTERDAALNALKAEKLSVQQQLESANETVSVAAAGCLTGCLTERTIWLSGHEARSARM
jgi:hypothetical protein